MLSRRVSLSVVVAAALVVASCGSDDTSSSSTESVAPTTEATPLESVVTTETPSETTDSMVDTTDGGGAVVDQAAIDAAAAAFLADQAAQGVTAFYVAISDPVAGEFSSAYGDASVDGPAATLDDNFRIGSISKTVTATVILQLVDSGDLALDDTVTDLLPDLAAEHPEIADLTVKQLLNMTSGISDYLNKVDTVVPVIVEDPSTVWAPEQLVAAGVAAGVDETRPPGYSTTNFIILQMIAEAVTGSSLQDLIAQRVTGPLGLDTMYLPPNDDTTLPDPATHGYIDGSCVAELAEDGATIDPGTDTTDWNASYGQGGGGMTSTIADLLGWAESGVGNSLLEPATADERLTSFELLAEGFFYGLGVMELDPWFGHEGEAIGWEAFALTNPDSGVSIAIAGNGCGGLITGFASFISALYPDAPIG